ncbi:MAG: serine/threonine-protein kinase, partial [Gemmatimonadaceae bacterium]
MSEPYSQLSALAAGLRERYDVLREVGRGGMATVYLGRDLRHERSVALKVMHPELAASVGAERFQREIRISASLTHPHILPLHDSGEVDGMLYYVMPYIEGESLRNMLDRERQLSLDSAVTLMREILDALGYAHAQGFVHRDVKPENILISGGHALVSDFGIARVAGIVTTTGITQSGLAVGSPVYMSPEQGAAEPHLDGRSDLYSAACVLFEMLVGAPPFTGASALRLLARHAIDPVPSVTDVRSDVGAAIDAVIARAMEKDPEDRYPSSRAFRIALDAATATVPAQNGARTSPPQYTSTSATQERASLSSGSVAVLPFADKSVTQDQEFLCDGIADEVRSALARLPSLKVAARSASLPYRNRTVAPADLGRELNVGSVLEGTVQRMGDR